MIVSEKRLRANRLNALKSTGPRTPEGKDRSRENAVKHGLTSLVLVREDPAAIQEEAEAMFASLKPRNRFQAELVNQVALINIRTRRAQAIERRAREKLAFRAMTSWDDDRKLEAERLGAMLSARPAEVVAELRRTPQGCDWLIGRWAMLAFLADTETTWAGERTRLAFHLLGTPEIFRVGDPGLEIDSDGRVVDKGQAPADVARRQIAGLRAAREVAAEHDDIDRALAESDHVDEATPELRRLRRHEASLHKRLRWCLATFKDPLPEHRTVHDLRPTFNPQTEEEYDAEVQAEEDGRIAEKEKLAAETLARMTPDQLAKFHADEEEARAWLRARAQNEPTLEVQDGPITTPEAPRVDARLRRAEARRGAKQRKLDRLRA